MKPPASLPGRPSVAQDLEINNFPAWLTDGSVFLAWLIGLFLIVWTVIKGGGDQGSARIKFAGLDLDVGGRSIFQVLLGAVLIVLPLILTNVVKAQVVPQQVVKTVDEIKDPDHTGFTFVRDLSVLDLRGSTGQPLLKHLGFLTQGRTNPASLINTMVIRKNKPLDTISFTYATSGSLRARCLTHQCDERRAMQLDEHASGILKETWELTAKITEVPVGQEFTLITEVTYWNAFDGSSKQWFATYANAQSENESLAIALLFPDGKAFSRYDPFQYPHGSPQAQPAQGNMRLVPGVANNTLYWEIFQSQSNYTYEIHWEY